MFKEYAVEPAAIGRDWDTFRYLIEQFGFSSGRLISRFPQRWEKRVIAAAAEAGMPDVRMKSLIERLKNAKRAAVADFGREYGAADSPTWIANALVSNDLIAFHAILALENQPQECVRAIDTLALDDPVMNNPHSADVPRVADDIANACSLLLKGSREIDLVDPFFFNLQRQTSGYREPLASILRDLKDSGKDRQVIRLHYKHSDASPSEGHVLLNAGNWLRNIIPDGFEVHLCSWEEVAGGEDFHDRFVLTDCGGLLFGAGLATAPPNEHVLVSILDTDHAASIRMRFANGSDVYRRIGSTVRVRSNGRTDLL